MNKADRQKIFDKYGGKCAYCGCGLVKGWHIDEIQPVRRRYKTIHAHYVNEVGDVLDDSRLDEFNKKFGTKDCIYVTRKERVFDGYDNPDGSLLNEFTLSIAQAKKLSKFIDTATGQLDYDKFFKKKSI